MHIKIYLTILMFSKLFPGIKIEVIALIMKNVKGIVIESFGAGNATNDPKLAKLFERHD